MEAVTHEIVFGDGISALLRGGITSLLYDPPWEISIPEFPMPNEVVALCDGFRAGDVVRRFGAPTWVFTWDCVSSWYTPNRPLRRAKYAFCYFDINKCTPTAFKFGDNGRPRIVKNSRGTFAYVPDGKKQFSDVYQHPITAKKKYKHQKPTEWIAYLLATCTTGVVVDPFCGSGSAIAACDAIGRKSVHYENDENMYRIALGWNDMRIIHSVRHDDLFCQPPAGSP